MQVGTHMLDCECCLLTSSGFRHGWAVGVLSAPNSSRPSHEGSAASAPTLYNCHLQATVSVAINAALGCALHNWFHVLLAVKQGNVQNDAFHGEYQYTVSHFSIRNTLWLYILWWLYQLHCSKMLITVSHGPFCPCRNWMVWHHIAISDSGWQQRVIRNFLWSYFSQV